MSALTPGQRLLIVHAKQFKPNGWVDEFPTWDDYDESGQAQWEQMAADFSGPGQEAFDALRQGLDDVCNPLGKLTRDAEAKGAKLSGQAYAIANDPWFVRSIAKEALSKADAILALLPKEPDHAG